MSRVVPLLVISVLLATGDSRLAEPHLLALQVRDPVPLPQQGPAQPALRRIPVGSASISGTVTDSATGRPIADVRVSLNGSSRPPDGPAGAVVLPSGRGLTNVVTGSGIVPGVQAGRGDGRGVASVLSLSRMAFTDAQGRFSFDKLPAGQFTISATRTPFLSASYGQSVAGGQGTAIRLADGERFTANLQLHRGGTISGTVLSDTGEPESRAQVRAYRITRTSGIKRLQQTAAVSSDDRGAYRIFGLVPGEYVIAASPLGAGSISERQFAESRAIEEAIASGAVQPPAAAGLPASVLVPVMPPPEPGMEPPSTYLPTYYPATLVAAEAATIAIGPNTERNGIDFQVQRVFTSSVTGTIALPPIDSINAQISLIPLDPLQNPISTRAGREGRINFRGVAPGKYRLLAVTVPGPQYPTIVNGVPTPPQPARLDDAHKLWARADVTVEPQSIAQVHLALQPGRTISGSVVFEMERPPDLSRARITVTLNPVAVGPTPGSGPLPVAQVQPDGRFTITGVVPGTYALRASGGALQSSIVDGQDTLDYPIDVDGERDIAGAVITVTDRTTELSGVISNPAGEPAFEHTIIAAAVDPRFWTPFSRRIVAARPDTTGRYVFRNLPPGAYFLAAVTDLEPGRQFDPDLLRTLAGASVHVTLAEGAKVTQALRVGR